MKRRVNENNEEMENFIDVLKRNYKNVPQFKYLLKLFGWILFFGVFFIIAIVGSVLSSGDDGTTKETTTTTSAVVKDSYRDVVNKLLFDKQYKYTININGSTIIVNGKFSNSVFDGYLEKTDGTVHFKIKENKIYVIKGNDEVEDANILNGLEQSFISTISLVDVLLNNNSNKFENDGVIKHEYTDILVSDTKYNIEVIDDSSNVNSIEISNDNISYSISVK